MLPDNRLDFIRNIDVQFTDMMTQHRAAIIELDSKLVIMSSLESAERPGVMRCLAEARTNLETSLQYAIKALCIMGEIK